MKASRTSRESAVTACESVASSREAIQASRDTGETSGDAEPICLQFSNEDGKAVFDSGDAAHGFWDAELVSGLANAGRRA